MVQALAACELPGVPELPGPIMPPSLPLPIPPPIRAKDNAVSADDLGHSVVPAWHRRAPQDLLAPIIERKSRKLGTGC